MEYMDARAVSSSDCKLLPCMAEEEMLPTKSTSSERMNAVLNFDIFSMKMRKRYRMFA